MNVYVQHHLLVQIARINQPIQEVLVDRVDRVDQVDPMNQMKPVEDLVMFYPRYQIQYQFRYRIQYVLVNVITEVL